MPHIIYEINSKRDEVWVCRSNFRFKKIAEKILKDINNYRSYNEIKNVRGAYNKFPDFFRMGLFFYTTHVKL